MTGDKERGDAVADKWRDRFEKAQRETDNALTRLDVRADMKSIGEDEISEVIDQRVLEAQRQKDDAKPENRVIGVLNVALGFKQWPQVIALAILVAGALAAYWLKTR